MKSIYAIRVHQYGMWVTPVRVAINGGLNIRLHDGFHIYIQLQYFLSTFL
jgi:hypothetical protein